MSATPLVLLVSAVLAGTAPASSADTVAVLQGRVVEVGTDAPVAGADVALEPTDSGGGTLAIHETDDAGAYRFDRVAPGRYTIRVTRIGYRPAALDVTVGRGSGPRVSVALTVEPVSLTPIDVVARGEGELRAPGGERVGGGRLALERLRQRRLLASDARIVSPSDVREAVTLGEPDVFRAMQRLPGVTTRDDFTAELWVRGASWGETRVLFDGLPLFNPLHGFGALSGMSYRGLGSAVFMPGVRPVDHPESGASLLDLHSRSGVGLRAPEAGVDLSLASVQGWGSGPIGGAGGWSFTARRSYADLVVERLDGSEDAVLPYSFMDAQGRVDLDLGNGYRLDASALWERDRLHGDIPDVLHGTEATWGNVLARASLSVPLGRVRARQTLGGTRYAAHVRRTASRFDDRYSAPSAEPADHLVTYLTLRGEVVPAAGGDTLWAVGYDLVDQRARYEGPAPWPYSRTPPDLVDERFDDQLTRLGVWGRRRWSVTSALSVDAGVRMSAGSATRAGSVEIAPSVAARLTLSPAASLSAAAGRYVQHTQSPAAMGPAVEGALDAGRLWVLAGSGRAPLDVRVGTLGAELWLGTTWMLSGTLYARRTDGVLLPDPTPGLLVQRNPLVEGSTEARGLDLSLRRHAGRVTGSLGYSYGDVEAHGAGRTFAAPTDRTHALDVTAALAVRPSLRLGAAYTFRSGAPYVRIVELCDEEGCGRERILDRPFERRTPGYSSLDVVMDWEKRFAGWSLGGFVQLRNALGEGNRVTYDGTASRCPGGAYVTSSGPCSDGSLPEPRDEFRVGVPTLPLVGLRIGF